MKLELKHLAGYLPYGLKIQTTSTNHKETYTLFSLDPFGFGFKDGELFFKRCKPILRPLSDLTKEIEVNGEKVYPIDWLNAYKSVNLIKVKNTKGEIEVFNGSTTNLRFFEYCIVEKLLEWHFDIYGLIENGLAIDINTL